MQPVVKPLPPSFVPQSGTTEGRPSIGKAAEGLQDECSGIAEVNKNVLINSPTFQTIMIVFVVVGAAVTTFCVLALIYLAVPHFLTK